MMVLAKNGPITKMHLIVFTIALFFNQSAKVMGGGGTMSDGQWDLRLISMFTLKLYSTDVRQVNLHLLHF
jgi:hypothetical protein